MYSSHTTRSGIEFDELFRWGDHVCHFYRSADDVGEILIPYFKAGLERNEACLWVTGHPFERDRAVAEMRSAVPDFDHRTAAGQMQIFDQAEWYGKLERMSTAEKVQSWLSRKDAAVGLGYAGLRLNGNTSYLDQSAWDDFLVYERAVSDAFSDQRIIGLCSYWMDRCSADGVVDALRCHGHGLAKPRGRWDLFEVRHHGRESSVVGHDPLASAGQGEDLRRLVEDQLAIFIGAYPRRIELKGGYVRLSRSQATKLAIVFNELVSNAAKYGALSTTQGKLFVEWHVTANGSRRLQITWIEDGVHGPVISDRAGFGTHLLAGAVENCVRTFNATGMVCAFELNLESSHSNES